METSSGMGTKKTGADLQGEPRRDPSAERTFGKAICEKGVSRSDRRLGKRRAMRVGAVLSNWVMELIVLALVSLVGRLFCSMASGFNSLAETLGAPHLHWKGFCFCGVVWRGAAHPPGAQRSGACPPVRAIRFPAERSEAKRSEAGALPRTYAQLGVDHYRKTYRILNYRIPYQSGRGLSYQSGRISRTKVAVDNLRNQQGFQHDVPKWP
jgi:hypothetical protein